MHSFRRQLRLLSCLACLSFVLPIAALAQTSVPAATPAPLPPEAQAAVDKGVLAAKQQDYLLAVRYFQDARKLAPQHPKFTMILVWRKQKIPRRELRAIAWSGLK